ncbi:MAG: hypothetical protein AAF802_12555 [Planctomycetota bacterium]
MTDPAEVKRRGKIDPLTQRTAIVNTKRLIRVSVAALLLTTISSASAQTPPVSAPTPTFWRFMGIPQGLQKIRDVTVNRRGNFPGLERKPAIKRIGDPSNLASDNPAIKAAAEIKQAEDMKAQKIKAIKFLAKMGCGCYDKDDKITDALLAAMDDCTPDVRLAAIEAIEDAANGECCTKCGSTSCCSEKVTKRLSEIAYERDDTGCCLEPSAEIREAAAKALCVCCPNRATGPIEEDIPETIEEIPTPPVTDPIKGEGDEEDVEGIQGEGGEEDLSGGTDAGGEDAEEMDSPELPPANEGLKEDEQAKAIETLMLRSAENAQPAPPKKDFELGQVKVIGGMTIQPVTLSMEADSDVEVVNADTPTSEGVTLSLRELPSTPAPLPTPVALPISDAMPASATFKRPATKPLEVSRQERYEAENVPSQKTTTSKKAKVEAKIVGVDYRTGRVVLRSGQPLRAGASVTVYHRYLTGERLIAHLLIKQVDGAQAIAIATDKGGLSKIEAGDRAVCF